MKLGILLAILIIKPLPSWIAGKIFSLMLTVLHVMVNPFSVCKRECRGNENGFKPFPNDCGRFCMCMPDDGKEMICGPGTIWCPQLNLCCLEPDPPCPW